MIKAERAVENMVETPLFLQNLDISVFTVDSQTTGGDRKSLLILQNIVRNVVPNYVYFEVGSHLGGTLVPHLADPACKYVYSIDKRPDGQLDQRGAIFDYVGNSTQRMLSTLQQCVPESSLLKMTTYDTDVSDLELAQVPLKVDFAFIDAEHTNVAVFRDLTAVLKFLADSFVVGFHDANLIFDGLENIECFLRYMGIRFKSFFLPNAVYAIVTGDYLDTAGSPLQRLSIDREAFIHNSRIALWRDVAANSTRIEGDRIGHL
jgi:hypothetical protein